MKPVKSLINPCVILRNISKFKSDYMRTGQGYKTAQFYAVQDEAENWMKLQEHEI